MGCVVLRVWYVWSALPYVQYVVHTSINEGRGGEMRSPYVRVRVGEYDSLPSRLSDVTFLALVSLRHINVQHTLFYVA